MPEMDLPFLRSCLWLALVFLLQLFTSHINTPCRSLSPQQNEMLLWVLKGNQAGSSKVCQDPLHRGGLFCLWQMS